MLDLPAIGELNALQRIPQAWMEEALQAELFSRDGIGSESLAVGSRAFGVRFQAEWGIRAFHREILQDEDRYRLREASAHYSSRCGADRAALRTENEIFLDQFA